MSVLATLVMLAALSGAPATVDALDPFAGNWHLSGINGSAKAHTSIELEEACRWSERGAYLICEQWKASNARRTAGVTLFFYDPSAKTYRFVGFGQDGDPNAGTIRIAPRLWTFEGGSGERRFRTTNRWSPDGRRIAYNAQMSTDGGKTWRGTGHGTETKTRQ